MATAVPAAPPQPSRSFAGLLEQYASAQSAFPPERDPDGLEDDVATLTYEQALKNRASYRTAAGHDSQVNSVSPPAGVASHAETKALPLGLTPAQPAKSARKSTSVTVRLTAEEGARMRTRASEAGLTISAYLRSCALDVDSLRAQVKEAVAHMREAEQAAPRTRRTWFARILHRDLGSG